MPKKGKYGTVCYDKTIEGGYSIRSLAPKLLFKTYPLLDNPKVAAGGPTPEQYQKALLENTYWVVLNSGVLGHEAIRSDEKLRHRANALKHALQTFGPTDEDNLPDLRSNAGRAKGHVYHGHVTASCGTTYVLEWEILAPGVMFLTRFEKHENYSFKKAPYTKDEKEALTHKPDARKTFENMETKRLEVQAKAERVIDNHPELRAMAFRK